jgi:hypothetical protein
MLKLVFRERPSHNSGQSKLSSSSGSRYDVQEICGTLSKIGRATDRDGHSSTPAHPIPRWVDPSRRFPEQHSQTLELRIQKTQKRRRNVFVELMPLLKQRTLLITVARIDENLKINVISKSQRGGRRGAHYPAEATQDLQRNWTESLASILPASLIPIWRSGARWPKRKPRWTRQPKPRGRRRRPRNTPQNPIQPPGKRRAQQQSLRRTQRRVCLLRKSKLRNLAQRRVRQKGVRRDRSKTLISQLHLQRCQTSGSRSENDGGRGEEPLQPSISPN